MQTIIQVTRKGDPKVIVQLYVERSYITDRDGEICPDLVMLAATSIFGSNVEQVVVKTNPFGSNPTID